MADTLLLPHERDERPQPETRARRRRVMLQAAADLKRGLVDTDNYTRAAEIAQHSTARRRRGS